MAQTGILFVLVGPGGVGKNVLMHRVEEQLEFLKQFPTATTRLPRDNEVEGIHHLFVSVEEFRQMIADGELLEYQEVTTNRFYGIPRDALESRLQAGAVMIADIEVYGSKILKDNYPNNIVLIFITPPGDTLDAQLQVLEQRMIERQDKPEVIQERLDRAVELELSFQDQCDYVIVNDDLATATRQLADIIQRELQKHRQTESLNQL